MHHNSGQLHLKQVCWQVTKKVAPRQLCIFHKTTLTGILQCYVWGFMLQVCSNPAHLPSSPWHIHGCSVLSILECLFAHWHGRTDRYSTYQGQWGRVLKKNTG